MGKLIFIIVGLGIGFIASFYYISSSLDDLSGVPTAITVEQLLGNASPKELEDLHDSKCRELAQIFSQVSNQSSAMKHRAAAQHAFIQMEMIRTRAQMLPAPPQTGLHPRSNPSSGTEELRKECNRLASMSAVRSELSSVLYPLNEQLRAFQISFASPSTVLLNQLSALRSQVELYKAQHRNRYPDIAMHGWRVLTQRTTRDGTFGSSSTDSPQVLFGPYVQMELVNPLTRSSQILCISGDPAADFKDRSYGFIYDTGRGRIWGINTDGTVFDEATARAEAR